LLGQTSLETSPASSSISTSPHTCVCPESLSLLHASGRFVWLRLGEATGCVGRTITLLTRVLSEASETKHEVNRRLALSQNKERVARETRLRDQRAKQQAAQLQHEQERKQREAQAAAARVKAEARKVRAEAERIKKELLLKATREEKLRKQRLRHEQELQARARLQAEQASQQVLTLLWRRVDSVVKQRQKKAAKRRRAAVRRVLNHVLDRTMAEVIHRWEQKDQKNKQITQIAQSKDDNKHNKQNLDSYQASCDQLVKTTEKVGSENQASSSSVTAPVLSAHSRLPNFTISSASSSFSSLVPPTQAGLSDSSPPSSPPSFSSPSPSSSPSSRRLDIPSTVHTLSLSPSAAPSELDPPRTLHRSFGEQEQEQEQEQDQLNPSLLSELGTPRESDNSMGIQDWDSKERSSHSSSPSSPNWMVLPRRVFKIMHACLRGFR